MRGEAHRFGGAARLFASALIEFVHSLLLAPVRMLFHTQFVLAALTGWRLDWKSPPRDDASTPWREAAARHGVHTLLAIAWIAAILATSAAFPWWLSPILAGLLLAIPLSVYTSRVRIGRALRKPRPDADARKKAASRASCARRAARGATVAERLANLREAIVDRGVQQRVISALPPSAAPSGAKAEAEAARIERALREDPEAISADAGLRLLSSRSALVADAPRSRRRPRSSRLATGARRKRPRPTSCRPRRCPLGAIRDAAVIGRRPRARDRAALTRRARFG